MSRGLIKTLFTLALFAGCAHQPNKADVKMPTYSCQEQTFHGYFNKEAKRGLCDGCMSAKGDYIKDHQLFQSSDNYRFAWFLGRNRCKDLI